MEASCAYPPRCPSSFPLPVGGLRHSSLLHPSRAWWCFPPSWEVRCRPLFLCRFSSVVLWWGALVAVGRGPVSRCGAVVSAPVILLRVLGERPSPARRLLGHLSPLSGIGVTTASLFLREASRILRSGSRPPVGALASSFPPFIHPRRPLRGSPHSLWGLLPGCARLPRRSLAAVSF